MKISSAVASAAVASESLNRNRVVERLRVSARDQQFAEAVLGFRRRAAGILQVDRQRAKRLDQIEFGKRPILISGCLARRARRRRLSLSLSEITAGCSDPLKMIQPPIVLIALCGFLRDGRSKLALLAQQPLPGIVIEKTDVAATLLQLLDIS